MKELLDSDRVNYLIWRFVSLRNAPRPVPRPAPPTAQPSTTARLPVCPPIVNSLAHSCNHSTTGHSSCVGDALLHLPAHLPAPPFQPPAHSLTHPLTIRCDVSLILDLACLLTTTDVPGTQIPARRQYVHNFARLNTHSLLSFSLPHPYPRCPSCPLSPRGQLTEAFSWYCRLSRNSRQVPEGVAC